jgi:hypothetical protein
VDGTGGVDADHVAAGGDVVHGIDRIGRARQPPIVPPLARTRHGGVEQEGILVELDAGGAQLGHEPRQPGAVGGRIAAERQRPAGVAASVDQVEGDGALFDTAGLAHAAAREADEVGALAGERAGEHLAAAQQRRDGIGEGEEGVLHGRQPAPPKTSTLRKRQVGAAWPTRMTWFGSPLPHHGVPSTATVSGPPTPTRLRQKVADTPR